MGVIDVKAVDGVRLVAEDFGDESAPAVLLLAGATMARQLWGTVVPMLSDAYRCVTFDWRDVGESDRSAVDYESSALAVDAVAVLDAFGIERAHVAGLSTGAHTGLRLAIDHAGRVRSLCTVSCWADVPLRLRTEFDFLIELARIGGWSAVFRLMAVMSFSDETVEALGEGLFQMGEALAPEFDLEAFERQIRAQRDSTVSEEELGRIAVPFLSLYGTEDLVVPRRYAEQLAKAVPGAALAAVDGVSHSVTIDKPDRYGAALRGWLDKVE